MGGRVCPNESLDDRDAATSQSRKARMPAGSPMLMSRDLSSAGAMGVIKFHHPCPSDQRLSLCVAALKTCGVCCTLY